jgi:hypothetical protein
MLGEVQPGEKGWSVCGIDLDGCLVNGKLTPEAKDVVHRIHRYTEVSPSGKGVHILFTLNNNVVEKLKADFGIEHRKTFSVGPHHEMSIDFSHRYYTFTGRDLMDFDMEDMAGTGGLEWLIRDSGPAFQRKFTNGGGSNGHFKIDDSRSGHAFRFFMQCYGRGMSEEEACREITRRKGPEGDWARTKGKDVREMQRCWSNAVRVIEDKKGGEEFDYLELTRASDIPMKPIKWMWPNYFAYGKVAMIVGDPDGGKSTVTIDLAARVTRGRRWPDGSGKAPQGDVVIFNAEDDVGDTLVPRLKAAGADMTRVQFAGMHKRGMFSLATHLKMLEDCITRSVRLVIIDPVSSFMGVAKIDTFRNTDVRGVLAPVIELASRKGVLILFVSHFNKNSGQYNALYRITDSGAFGAVCRHIYSVTVDPEDEDRKLFLKVRNSIAPQKTGLGLGYYVENVNLGDGVRSSRLSWDRENPVDISIDEVLRSRKHGGANGLESAKTSEKLTAAYNLLADLLGPGKPVPAAKIYESASLRNIARRTLQRAADLKNINRINDSGQISWILPA